jgi:hypothetical protein
MKPGLSRVAAWRVWLLQVLLVPVFGSPALFCFECCFVFACLFSQGYSMFLPLGLPPGLVVVARLFPRPWWALYLVLSFNLCEVFTEPTTSSLGAMSPYHQAKARAASTTRRG